LKGSSFHSEYTFSPSKRLSSELVLGEISHRSSEVLRQGDVRAIQPGPGFIHSLVHLEPPSVSIVVRTPRTTAGGPQYNYALPGLATDPFHKPEPLQTQLALLQAILATDPQRFESLATKLIQTRDLWTALKIAEIAGNTADERLFDTLVSRIAQKAPELGNALVEAHKRSIEDRELIWLFKQVRDWETRYLLASLLSGAPPAAILAAMKRDLRTEDTIRTVIDVLEGLPDSVKADVSLTKIHLRLFELTMRGVPYETMRENWLQRFASDDSQGTAFERAWSELHSSTFLNVLGRSITA
jgi:hypothetical protein